MSEESLQITKERREVKNKRELERYTQLNAEFQRLARSDEMTILNECKEIEKNNRMSKTRGLLKKTEAIKGTFHMQGLA